MSNKLKWLFIASIILNTFLLGGLVAGAYKFSKHEGGHYGGSGPLHAIAENLPDEKKIAFKKILHESRQSSMPLVKASGQARAEVLKQLSAPTFDRLTIENAMARTREADRAVRMHMEEAIINFAETLTPEERHTLAEGLAKKGPLRPPPMLSESSKEHREGGSGDENGMPATPPPEHDRE